MSLNASDTDGCVVHTILATEQALGGSNQKKDHEHLCGFFETLK
jgi:hypothetical protein